MYSHSRALVQCRRFRVFGIWFISLFFVGSMPLAAHADNEKVMAVMSRQAGEVADLAGRLAKMEALSTSQTQDMAALRERHAQEIGDLDAEVGRLEGVESDLRKEIEALKAALLAAQQMQKRFAEEKESLASAAVEGQQAAVARVREEAEETKRRLEEQRIQTETRHSEEVAALRKAMEAERGTHAVALQKAKTQMEAELVRRSSAMEAPMSRLKEEIAAVRAERDALEAQRTAQAAALKKLTGESKTTAHHRDELEEQARKETAHHAEEMRRLREKHSQVLAEREAAWQRESDEQRDMLRRSLEKEHAEALRQQRERLEDEMRLLGEDIERQLKEAHNSRAAAERARAADGRAHAKEKEALEAELAQRRQEAQEAREETGRVRAALEKEAAENLQQERAALHKEHAAELAGLRREQTRLLEEQRQHLKAVAEKEKRQASLRLEEEKERSVAEAIARTQTQVSQEARAHAQAAQEEGRLQAVEEAVNHARDEVRAEVEAKGRHAQERALAEMRAEYEAKLEEQQRAWAAEKQALLEEQRTISAQLEAALGRVSALEAAQIDQERGHVRKMDALRAKMAEYEAERSENEERNALHHGRFQAQAAEMDQLKERIIELEEDARFFTQAFGRWEAQHSRTSLAKVVASFELLLAGEGVEDAHRRAKIIERYFGDALAKQALRDEESMARRDASSVRTPSRRGATERETLELFDGDSDISEPSSTSVRVDRRTTTRRDRESLAYLDVTFDGSPASHQAAPASPAPFSRSHARAETQRGAALDDVSLVVHQHPRSPSYPDAEATLPLTRRHLALLGRDERVDGEKVRREQHIREREGVERGSGSFPLSSHDHGEDADQAALDQARLKFEQQRLALQQLEAGFASDDSSATSSDEEGTPPRRSAPSARSHVSSTSEISRMEGASIRGGVPRVRRTGDALADAED